METKIPDDSVESGVGINPDRPLRANLISQRRDPLLEVLTSRIVLIVSSILAVISVAAAVGKAARASMDFQWSGAHLLLHHRDPWAVYLSGDSRHEILLSQVPNYLHELYVLLLPLGLLSFSKARLVWEVCNLVLVFIVVWSVSRLCELGKRKTWLLFVLVLTGTPFRVTVGNGQSDAVALAAIALWSVVLSQSGRGLLLGVSYEKYSFQPIFVLFLLLRQRWKLLIFSLFPPLLGYLLVDEWVGTGWRTLAFEPFKTATRKGSVTPGLANVIDIARLLLAHISCQPQRCALLPYGLAILLAFIIAAFFARYGKAVDGRILLACMLAASLVCFQHLIYDFIVLIFSLGVALKSQRGGARNLVLVLIAYFWYLERALGIWRWESSLLVISANFCVLLLLIAATYRLHKSTEWSCYWNI